MWPSSENPVCPDPVWKPVSWGWDIPCVPGQEDPRVVADAEGGLGRYSETGRWLLTGEHIIQDSTQDFTQKLKLGAGFC